MSASRGLLVVARRYALLTLFAFACGGVRVSAAMADAPPATLRHAYLESARGGGFQADGGGYRLETRRMSARVGVGGLSVSTPGAAKPIVGMRLGGVGRGQEVVGAEVLGLGAQDGQVRVRYQGLTEWYRDTPLGLEQGFIVEQPPPGEGPVALRLELEGPTCGAPAEDGRSLRFDVGKGNTLHYDGLAAFDAAGRELEANLACAEGAILIHVDDHEAVYPITVDPLFFLETKITAPDGAAGDRFGIDVALSGDTALVGAPNDGGQGSAYVFVRSGGTWVLQARLTASDGAFHDSFGVSVAISGDMAIIGAGWDDVGENVDQGSAYVFVRSGTTWSQQAKLTASDGAPEDLFGLSVAISGETALIGAESHAVGSNAGQGSAYVFVRSGTTWSQQAKLTASDGEAEDLFGLAIALSGETALVGAWGDRVGSNHRQGSAYVFVRSGTTWSQQAQLTASDGGNADWFGLSVALSGETALVGAGGHDVGVKEAQGAAYVFVRSGTNWSQEQELIASDGEADDLFGGVALSGDTAIIAASYDDVGANVDQGSAYVFVRSGTSWSQQAHLTASDGEAGDRFGIGVALSGNAALVGAWCDVVGANAAQGSAYLFGPLTSGSDHDLAAGAAASTTTPHPGDTVFLSATVTNHGPASAADVLVKAPVPAGLTVVASSASTGTYDPSGEGSWSVGTLAPGVTATASVQATVDASAAGRELVFEVALEGTDLDPADDVAAITLAIPPLPPGSDHDLAAGVAASSTTPHAGATVLLSASVTNHGPGTAADVLVHAPVPAGLTVVASSASIGTYDPSGEGFWSVGTLAPGVTAVALIGATVDTSAAGRELDFEVALEGTDLDPADDVAAITLAVPFLTLSRVSRGSQDGWVLESFESSGAGGRANAGTNTLLVGDDGGNRQYRSVLSFDTSALPDNAVVHAATLRFKSAGVVGRNPSATHGSLVVDLMKGSFSGKPALQTTDFQARPTKALAGTIAGTPVAGWYRGSIFGAALPAINRTGLTQLRLSFTRGDDNDRRADYFKLWSGDASATSRPVLVVEYSLP